MSDATEIEKVTAAVREADQLFQKVGGSSRHWVAECFLPILAKHGLALVSASAPSAAIPAPAAAADGVLAVVGPYSTGAPAAQATGTTPSAAPAEPWAHDRKCPKCHNATFARGPDGLCCWCSPTTPTKGDSHG